MLVDITIDAKNLDAIIRFEVENLKDEKSYKDSLAIISMVAGDYSLDPELEISELKDMAKMALDKGLKAIIFDINEPSNHIRLLYFRNFKSWS